jgi:hypothetical protein
MLQLLLLLLMILLTQDTFRSNPVSISLRAAVGFGNHLGGHVDAVVNNIDCSAQTPANTVDDCDLDDIPLVT